MLTYSVGKSTASTLPLALSCQYGLDDMFGTYISDYVRARIRYPIYLLAVLILIDDVRQQGLFDRLLMLRIITRAAQRAKPATQQYALPRAPAAQSRIDAAAYRARQAKLQRRNARHFLCHALLICAEPPCANIS